MRWLIDGSNIVTEPSDAQVSTALGERDEPPQVWLELAQPSPTELAVLHEALGTKSLAMATALRRFQRPSVDSFGPFCMLVLIITEWSAGKVQQLPLHLYLGKDLLVTVHQDEVPILDDLRKRFADPQQGAPEGLVSYTVIDSVVDAGFDVLQALDREIDSLQDAIVNNPTPAVLRQIYELKHEVASVHNVLGAQMDVFQRLLIYLMQIDRSQEMEIAFRSIYDNAVRQYEMVDSLRDLITGAMDVYLSTISNRLDSTMAQLTIIASIFLPLTFLTGFFGMNFSFLVGLLTGPRAFIIGLVVMAASVALMVVLFRWRHWL